MDKHISKLKRETTFLKIYAFILTIAVLVLFTLISNQNQDIIRAKGIVIEDANGKERILIGAPIPYATNRIRTDSVRAKEAWGYIHPDYMSFYKKYDHSNNGILILDANGHDRIAIGNNTPDPNIGKRIAPSSGIILNDENGFERSGYGILKVNGITRVNLGLDTNKGSEGLVLSVDDNGTTGIGIRNSKQTIFLGSSDSLNGYTRKEYPYNGLRIEDATGLKFNFNSIKKNKLINQE